MQQLPERDLRHEPEWLDGLRAGDRRALARAVEAYSGMLHLRLGHGFSTTSDGQRVRLRVHDPEERDEIVQETFARAFRASARSRYSGSSDYGAYLLRICRNLAIDRFRRTCSERAVIAPAAVDLLERAPMREDDGSSGVGGSPERAVARNQIAGLMRDFLAELDDQDLRLMRLYAEDDVSQRGAADALGVERHAVRARLADVRSRLLRFMKRRGAIDALDVEQLMQLVTVTAAALSLVMR